MLETAVCIEPCIFEGTIPSALADHPDSADELTDLVMKMKFAAYMFDLEAAGRPLSLPGAERHRRQTRA